MQMVLKIFSCLLVGGITFTAGQADDINMDGQSFPENPSTIYNPVNSITVNTCCNKSKEHDNFQEKVTEIKEAFAHLVNELSNGDFCSYVRPASALPTSVPVSPQSDTAIDCYDIQQTGETTSGVYMITPENSPSFEVYCDMDTDGGGWTVFQRRVDGSTDFYLYWEDYKVGFGSLSGNFWLGNEYLYYLTSQKNYTLRVDLGDFDDNTAYAVYNYFHVANESMKYKLSLGEYSGDAGDAMAYHNGQRFATRDDDDNGCALEHEGGWWYQWCYYANLNGPYQESGSHETYAIGIQWEQWKGYSYSLKFTEMKLRPTNRF